MDETITPIDTSGDTAVASSGEESMPDSAAAAPELPGGAVDAALASLDSLVDRPLSEHPDVYQSIHRTLQDALAEINEA